MRCEGRSAGGPGRGTPANEGLRNNTGTFAEFPAPAITCLRLAEPGAVAARWSMLPAAEMRAAILGRARP